VTDGPTTRSGTPAAARTTSPFTPALRTTTLGMIALVALGAFESLAVTTAMPSVVAELGGYALYAAAFAGPVASSVVGLTLAGRWCDRGSPVAALLTGVGLFVVGLLAAGLTSSMLVVVAGRIVMGVGSGVFGVVMYVVVARVYPESAQPRVFGAFAAAWVVPGMVGPLVAGLVVEHAGWRWVFLAVAVLAVPAVVALWPSLADLRTSARATGPTTPAPHPEGSEPAAPTARDRPLVALAVVAAAGVLALHHAGQQSGGSAALWALAGAAAVALALPRLLPAGTLRAARGLPTVIALRGLASAAFFSAEVAIPLLLQTHRGLSPAAAGAVLTCSAITWSLGSWLRGHGVGGAGDVAWLHRGLVAMIVGIVLAASLVVPAVPLVLGYVGWAVAGLGMGVAFPTLSLLTLRLSAPSEQGANSSALQVMDATSVALVLALTGSLLTALGGPADVRAFVAGFAVAAGVAGIGVAVAHRVVAHPADAPSTVTPDAP
jgi:MFS family permease